MCAQGGTPENLCEFVRICADLCESLRISAVLAAFDVLRPWRYDKLSIYLNLKQSTKRKGKW
jgi:hypothetical protein